MGKSPSAFAVKIIYPVSSKTAVFEGYQARKADYEGISTWGASMCRPSSRAFKNWYSMFSKSLAGFIGCQAGLVRQCRPMKFRPRSYYVDFATNFTCPGTPNHIPL